MPDSVLAPIRRDFRALAAVIVPEAAELAPAGWEELEATVECVLAARPAERRQLVAFVRLLDVLAFVRHGRSIAAIGGERRLRLLRRMERAPVLPLRRGFQALRTLVFMGYYTRPAAVAGIGYRAHPRGWEAHQ